MIINWLFTCLASRGVVNTCGNPRYSKLGRCEQRKMVISRLPTSWEQCILCTVSVTRPPIKTKSRHLFFFFSYFILRPTSCIFTIFMMFEHSIITIVSTINCKVKEDSKNTLFYYDLKNEVFFNVLNLQIKSCLSILKQLPYMRI